MNITSSHSTQIAGCIVCEPSKIVRGLSYASKVLAETAKKIAFIVSIYFMKAVQMLHTGLVAAWGFTKEMSHEAAELAKRVGNALLVFSHFAADKIVKYSKDFAAFAQKTAHVACHYIRIGAMHAKAGLQIAWAATKDFGGKTLEAVKSFSLIMMDLLKKLGQHVVRISVQVSQTFAKYCVKFAQFSGKVLSQAAAGLTQGFRTVKLFIGTHQKETAIAGCAIGIGVGITLLVNRLFAHSKKSETPTAQTV